LRFRYGHIDGTGAAMLESSASAPRIDILQVACAVQIARRYSRLMEPLDAILDRLIPSDDTPGAAVLNLAPHACRQVADLDLLVARLAGFEALTMDDQETVLQGLDDERDPIFAALVTTVHELYYADHRSWPALGYTTHLPGRP
jgi:hypothetical protein